MTLVSKHFFTIILVLNFSVFLVKAQKPNVVFVLTDQWRAQDVEYAGNTQVKTPAINKLSEEGVNFTNAISNIPVCTPARASLMTGRYPLSHGLFYNDKPLKTEEYCLAEVYKENGYKTGYIGKWHINGQGRSTPVPADRRQGFDYWKVHECTHSYNNSIYYDENNVKHTWTGYDAFAQTKAAVNYIEANKDTSFVLFLSFGPPHAPYNTAPQKYQDLYANMDIQLRPNVPSGRVGVAKEAIRGYYAHMSALDSCVAELQEKIKNLGLEENTIFVFTSDHGDMLYSHNETKKQKPWEESICVPFILKYPAQFKEGDKMTKMFSYPDIMPTLLGLCDLPIPESVEGVDYSGQLLGTEELAVGGALITCPVPFHQWKYSAGGREYRGIRTERYTYVNDLYGSWLLYDNLSDPYQQNNLVNKPEYKPLKDSLNIELQLILDKHGDEFLPGAFYMNLWDYSWDGTDFKEIAQNAYADTPSRIPGLVESENYDIGGEGKAFHDIGTNNQNKLYRLDGFGIADTDAGYVIENMEDNEWLEYKLIVTENGIYNFEMFYATDASDSKAKIGLSLPDEHKVLVDTVSVPATASSDLFKLKTIATNITLFKGYHILRLTMLNSGMNLDYFKFNKTGDVSPGDENSDSTLYGTVFGIKGIKPDKLIETIYDGDLQTAPDITGDDKDFAWAVIDFGEESLKTFSGVRFALRVPTNLDNVGIMRDRLKGMKFYGATTIDTANNRISYADTTGNLLYEITEEDVNALILEEYSDVKAVVDSNKAKGFRYVVMFFSVGGYGNCGEVKIYGSDYVDTIATAITLRNNHFDFKAYINDSKIIIDTNSAQSEIAQIEVFDIYGKSVFKQKQLLHSGINQIQIKNNLKSNNIYIIKIQKGEQSFSKKVFFN